MLSDQISAHIISQVITYPLPVDAQVQDNPDTPLAGFCWQGDMDGGGVKAGRWGGKAHAYSDEGSFSACRVTTRGDVKRTQSSAGYDSFERSSTTGTYSRVNNTYCDCGHNWVYTGDIDLAGCQAKCEEHSCTCFDFASHKPGPRPGGSSFIGSGIKGSGACLECTPGVCLTIR